MNDTALVNSPKGKELTAIQAFLLTTIPIVILYFTGWTYLYLYFDFFGINISELKLDLQTVLMYSYAPFHYVIVHFQVYVILAVVVLIYAVAWMLPCIRDAIGSLVCALGKIPVSLRRIFYVGLLFACIFLFARLIRVTAFDAAKLQWNEGGIAVEVVLRSEDERSAWGLNLKRCVERSAARLVFADEDGYYLICRSSVTIYEAVVYEVRHEGGLASIRFPKWR